MGNTASISAEAELKIYRQLVNEQQNLAANGIEDKAQMYERLEQRHSELSAMYSTTTFVCPKVRFGRTNLQMPILTCGGMRQQETWSPPADMTLENINKHVQANFAAIVDRSMKLGINHFETARAYGTSEVQYGEILKKYPRESYILQTKGVPKAVQSEFRAILEKSFKDLQLDGEGSVGFVDLFSFHGLNRMEHIDWISQPGGCLEVVREYQAAGKIKFVGFSSHGSTEVIVKAIETGIFDYVNLHYHFIGSYVSTGTGPCGGNHAALVAAQAQDMGVFIISPTDKGGALYEPPRALYKACLPLTPIAFNNLYLWAHDIPIHTLVIGAARPEDFDEHVEAAMMYEKRYELLAPVETRVRAMVTDVLGSDFFEKWYEGLPDAFHNSEGMAIGFIYWLWWIVKCWGLYSYAVTRYGFQESALKTWDDSKPVDENTKAFGWVSGVAYRPEREAQLREVLAGHPKADHIVGAIKEIHELLREGGCVKRGAIPTSAATGIALDAGVAGVPASEWTLAYNLQSDKPYCERQVR